MTVLFLGKAFVMSLEEAFTFRLAIKNRHFNSEFSNKTVESIKVFSTPLTAARIICRILYLLHTKYVETPENGKHHTLYLLRVSVDKMFSCQYLFVKTKMRQVGLRDCEGLQEFHITYNYLVKM